MSGAFHQKLGFDEETRRALRAHDAKYGLDAHTRRRLKGALDALEDMREPVLKALEELGAPDRRVPWAYIHAALRLLMRGADGRFEP